jgi:RNA polymerase sigma factor (sigma-70 family)
METPALECNIVGVDAFEEIYRGHRHFVTQCVYYMLDHKHSAYVEDLVQETFLKAYRAFQEGKTLPSAALNHWLARIAKNLVIDMFRRQDRAVLVSFTIVNQHDTEQESALGDETKLLMTNSEDSFEQRLATCESIEQVLRKMPPASAACLWHHEYSGLSCIEIAELLHMNVSTVRVYLMRARKYFKKLYQYEK